MLFETIIHFVGDKLIKLMKGKALMKHSLHEKNSSLGFIEAVHQ